MLAHTHTHSLEAHTRLSRRPKYDEPRDASFHLQSRSTRDWIGAHQSVRTGRVNAMIPFSRAWPSAESHRHKTASPRPVVFARFVP